jgi:hypothetical protein
MYEIARKLRKKEELKQTIVAVRLIVQNKN